MRHAVSCRKKTKKLFGDFLATHPQFTLLNCAELLSQQKIPLNTGEFLQLSPQLHQTDGFFAAALTRIDAAESTLAIEL
jgi:16S rRNA (cytosine967-C5)-methyltransferase